MSETTADLLWIAGILRDLYVPISLPVTLHCDDKASHYIDSVPQLNKASSH